MKILHALVSYYLAVTALTSSFHPFAFAHPLPVAAIDYYDGYASLAVNHIDGTLTEHFLGNIAETCHWQAVPKNHSDSALMKRVPGDILKERQIEVLAVTVPAISVVAEIIFSAVWIANDDPKRGAFTQGIINQLNSRYSKYNWIICHSPHSVGFDGIEGTDWGRTYHELKISFGRTIGYHLYWARSGLFYRYGDGGYINWAYHGNVLKTDEGGALIYFGTRS